MGEEEGLNVANSLIWRKSDVAMSELSDAALSCKIPFALEVSW